MSNCVATWAAYGTPCDREAVKWLADVPLCDHHYWRAVDACGAIWMRQRDEEHDYFFGAREWEASAAEVVYYVQRLSDGLVKIGTSAVFRARLSSLRGEHGPVQVLLTHRGDRKLEEAMHRRFRKLWVEGEFFRPRKPLMTWIIDIRGRQPAGSLLRGTLPMADLMALAARRGKP